MGRIAPGQRAGMRRAVVASVALHAILVAVAVVVISSGRETGPVQVGVKADTRVRDIEVHFPEEAVAVAVPAAPSTPPPASAPTSVPEQPPETGRTPHAIAVPPALSANVVVMIRRPVPSPSAIVDTQVKPAAARTAPPIHGAMRAGQSVVYVLDCSGSMGEFGKLDLARDGLLATLRQQPADVKFQVIAYNTTARLLLPGSCVPATPANLAEAREQLAPLRATGRSNHAEAVRLAATLKPDVIVLLTDATDLTATQFKSALGGKTVPVCAAAVAADGVSPPRQLR